MALRILVTGSRDWRERNTIRAALLDVLGDITTIGAPVLIHGGQESHDPLTGEVYGADYLAGEVWREFAVARPGWLAKPEVYPANWRVQGKGAGPLRNQRMVDSGADVCLAFPLGQSRGTWDCIHRARHAGIPVRLVGHDGWTAA